ncbi:hypothetical protein CKG00_07625 [Morganella morganii]|uniref:Uncharacterized protein n=1 Tax=Morganella morganii TaxID=582 RepID=A0A433ZW10_MORMO|nr:hypothetical protein CKG00_07625 [Morganella morganii]
MLIKYPTENTPYINQTESPVQFLRPVRRYFPVSVANCGFFSSANMAVTFHLIICEPDKNRYGMTMIY